MSVVRNPVGVGEMTNLYVTEFVSPSKEVRTMCENTTFIRATALFFVWEGGYYIIRTFPPWPGAYEAPAPEGAIKYGMSLWELSR